jgi:Tfp pilus assembly protein PilN
MADIDMIPRSYRDGVRARRTLRRTALALAIVVLAGAAGGAGLRWRNAAMEREAAQLRAAAAQAQSAQARDAMLREADARNRQQAALLRALRRQGEVAALAQAIDDALPPQAWLTGIALRRDVQQAGIAAAGAPAPVAGATDAVLELAGGAPDHETVTAFLARLGGAPGVAAVRLQSSGPGEGGDIVFQALATLHREDKP